MVVRISKNWLNYSRLQSIRKFPGQGIQKNVSGKMIYDMLTFKMFVELLSHLYEDLAFKYLIIFVMSAVEV
jgi:hypothetical protein